MSVTATFTIDIHPSIRTATNDVADNQLVYADHSVQVTFEDNGVAWAVPAGSTWELVLVNREDPVSGVLARSTAFAPAPDDAESVFVFSLPTNTVELREYLADSRGKNVIVELVRTDLTVEQTVARWTVTAWNQGWDPSSAVYAELKHKSTCTPDREPTADDDTLLGYAIGSIWVYCTGHTVWLCTDATAGVAVWRCWFDRLVPTAELGTSVPIVTSRLPMDSTTSVPVGTAIEVVQSGVSTWHMVTALAAGYAELMGPPLTIGTQIDLVRVLDAPTLLNMMVSRTAWDNAVSTSLLSTIERTGFTWEGPAGHMVGYRAMQMEANGTSQGTVHVLAAGNRVSTTGVLLSTSGVWVDNGLVAIDKTKYSLDRGDAVELECSAAGVAGIGRFLTVKAVVVTEE